MRREKYRPGFTRSSKHGKFVGLSSITRAEEGTLPYLWGRHSDFLRTKTKINDRSAFTCINANSCNPQLRGYCDT